MGAPGSSALFATPPGTGAAAASRPTPTCSMKSNTAVLDPRPIRKTLLLQIDDGALIERATSHLPDRFRELLVLRELRGLSYREVADVMAIPMGSVMSGLSRARQAFRGAMNDELKRSGLPPRTHPRDKEAVAAAESATPAASGSQPGFRSSETTSEAWSSLAPGGWRHKRPSCAWPPGSAVTRRGL